jgi:hypothetical protein
MTDAKPQPLDLDYYRDALRAALSSDWLDAIGPTGEGPPQALQAAFRLAVDLGWCRLFDLDAGDLDGSLPAPWALAAARAESDLLTHWQEDALALPRRWAECDDPAEAEELCTDLLERRMESWAAYVVIDEAHADCLEEDGDRAGLFARAVSVLLDRLEAFDRALRAESELLSVAVGTSRLEFWRGRLAPEFHEPLPWWLDERFRVAADETRRRALATLPRPALWRRRRLQGGRLWGHAAGRVPPCAPASLAAASAPVREPLPGAVLAWLSPDGAQRALLVLPEWTTPQTDQTLRPVNFVRSADDVPAVDLAGALVLLAGVEGRIDDRGRAWVRLADLRGAEDLTLHVGEALDLWQPSEEND